MSLRDQLEQVRADFGRLTPANVVDAARATSHPLHDRFEWDDSIAGERYRRIQARELIRSVRCQFISTSGPASLRVFHSVAKPTPVYEPIDDIIADPIAQQLLVTQMRRDWAVFEARYGHLVEFTTLVTATKGATVP